MSDWPPAGHDRQRELFEDPGKTLPEQIEGDHAYRDDPPQPAPQEREREPLARRPTEVDSLPELRSFKGGPAPSGEPWGSRLSDYADLGGEP